ncbi:MAG: type 1 glutamine amidotransferase [Patescibacteria group bacterium]
MKKILLIQIRDNKIIADHEFQCFKKATQGEKINLERVNIYFQDFSPDKIIKKYNGFLTGGSNFSIKDKFPRKAKLFKLVKKIIEREKPFLGICFGFQVLVEAAGGRVIFDKKKEEFGSKIVYLNNQGRQDKLFENLKRKFYVQQGHEWRVAKLPTDMLRLASGNAVLNQAVKIIDTPVYGIQFHPELDKKAMLWRLNLYKTSQVSWYSFKKNPFHKLLPTSSSKKVLSNFIKHIVK